MELALSLGDRPKPLSFLEKLPSNNNNNNNNNNKMMVSVSTKDVVGFCCMALGGSKKDDHHHHQAAAARSADVSCSDDHIHHKEDDDDEEEDRGSSDPPPNLQLHLLPFSPPPVQTSPPPPTPPLQLRSFPWLTDNLGAVAMGCSSNIIGKKEVMVEGEVQGRGTAISMSSPNSTSSSFKMDFSMYNINVMYNNRSTSSNMNMNMNMNMKKRDRFETNRINNYNEILMETAAETTGGSDEDENIIISNNNNINEGGRKKLRLTKDQSAFLEDSFKVHSTLNPKQKQALAKQLNLRPRQVEVWFQNRRARTKLKQTEIDCEYLKRCCDKLTEENRKLQKELQELRALKSSQPFYMQLPATTLTMCPSCERVATTTTTAAATPPPPATSADGGNSTRVVIAKPIRAIPFSAADSLIGDHHHDTTQTHMAL